MPSLVSGRRSLPIDSPPPHPNTTSPSPTNLTHPPFSTRAQLDSRWWGRPGRLRTERSPACGALLWHGPGRATVLALWPVRMLGLCATVLARTCVVTLTLVVWCAGSPCLAVTRARNCTLAEVTVGDDHDLEFRRRRLGTLALGTRDSTRDISTESLARAVENFVNVATIPAPEVILGQVVLLRTSLKLLSFATYCESSGRDTKRLFGKVDGKVWKLVANPTPPHVYTDPNQEHSRLSLRYVDGFPDDWKQNDDLVKKAIGSFRIFARFWYHIIYENTPGSKLAVHQTDLPEDHPTTEVEALRQVGALYSAQTLDSVHSLDSPASHIRQSSVSINPTPSDRLSSEPAVPRAVERRSETPPRDLRRHSVDSSVRKPVMPTEFPMKIKADNVLAFNGIPGKVASLDITVDDMCTEHEYPAYYGGTVRGSARTKYEYVEPGTPGSADNYHFGMRICSSITGKFVDNARMWWEDYRKYGGVKPNCWKKSELHPDGSTKPDYIEEISLYEILRKSFPEENDEIEAGLELKRYKWNPSLKDAVPFSTFRTFSRSLALRAGYEKWRQRMPLIIQCIEPSSLRASDRIYDDEEKFWFECRSSVNTWLNSHPAPTAGAARCGTCNGAHDTDSCRKGLRPKAASSSKGDAVCDWCDKKGHYKNECLKLRGQISRGEISADERNRRGGPSTAPAASRPPGQQRLPFLPKNAKPAGGQYKRYTCTNCGGSGHSASVCPTRATASAATKFVDSDQKRVDGQPDVNSSLYFMDWTPARNDIADLTENLAKTVSSAERIDELFSTRYADQLVEFPVFNSITSPTDTVEVIDNVLGKTAKTSVVRVSDAMDMSALGPSTDEVPTGPVWTISSTLRGQDMLTIFDTGAVKAAVPVSTANGSLTP
ncbi:hypothetical protein EDC01DRAFT_627733 [Geopyxis carbonaria]|nr:hypothetical protein EDC01DRAFT_627733 [Geopyxis carbonaria]